MSVVLGEAGREEDVLSGSFAMRGMSRSKTTVDRVCLLEERENKTN